MRPSGRDEGLPPLLRHYSLPGLLPPGHILALHTEQGFLSRLTCEDGEPRVLMQEQLTATEITALHPMLELHPTYCPNETLYANFYRNTVEEQTVNCCREHLLVALQQGIYDQEMRSVRGAVSRLRLKLRHFGIDMRAILATGYLLFAYDEQQEQLAPAAEAFAPKEVAGRVRS